VELEGLEVGVTGKRSLWQALGHAFPDDARVAGFDLDALVARADQQLEGLREHRLSVAGEALTAVPGSPDRGPANVETPS
jgi:hypothetical protein